MAEPILIVDDNLVNLQLLKVVLATRGYEIRTATTAEEALVVLETFRPRLLLLDLRLPGMDGLALARLLRDAPATRDLIIVAVSAHAMHADRAAALAAGFDDFITKPIDTRALPEQVAGFLRLSRA